MFRNATTDIDNASLQYITVQKTVKTIIITIIIFVHSRFLSMAFHATYYQKVLLRIFRGLN